MRRSRALSLAALLTPALLAAQQPPPLTLSEAIRLAVAASPTLAATTAAARQAESNVRNAKAALYPELGAEGTAVRHEEPMIAFPLHELTVTTRPEFDETLFQGNLLFGFTVFDGGIRRGQVSQARANETAATERQSGSAQGVVAGTTRSFVEVLTADAVLAAQEARVQALEAEVNRARRFLAEGRAARVEVLRAEAALAQAPRHACIRLHPTRTTAARTPARSRRAGHSRSPTQHASPSHHCRAISTFIVDRWFVRRSLPRRRRGRTPDSRA